MELVRHDANGRRYIVYCCDRCGKVTDGVHTFHTCSPNPVIEQLRAKVEELEKDAERYWWLREQHWSDDTLTVTKPECVRLGSLTYSLERLDQVIDTAIKESK